MTGPSPDPDHMARLGRLGPPYLALVLIEFLLGMSLNLFVVLPTGSPLAVLTGSPLLDVHVAFGVLLLGIAANAVRLAIAARIRAPIVVSAMGLASGAGAFVAGLSFAFGSPSALASFAMSVGFVGLLVAAGFLMNVRARALASREPHVEAPTRTERG